MKRILITGASGFIGHRLSSALLEKGFALHLASRSGARGQSSERCRSFPIDAIDPRTDWSDALAGVDRVVHLAAMLPGQGSLADYRRVNVSGTEKLARDAARSGVERFVFMSTVGVNGNESGAMPFTESDAPRPHDDYSLSKREAEQVLTAVSGETGMETVSLRAPLVYGPGAKGKLLFLLRCIDRGLPLPLGGLDNRRSLLYLDNLVDVILLCLASPAMNGRTYMVSDGEDLSTAEFAGRLARAMGRPTRLLRVPANLLEAMAGVLGRASAVRQLSRPLLINGARIRRELGWRPAYSVDEGIRRTVEWYLARQAR